MPEFWRGSRVKCKDKVPPYQRHYGRVGTLDAFVGDDAAVVIFGGKDGAPREVATLPLDALRNVTQRRRRR